MKQKNDTRKSPGNNDNKPDAKPGRKVNFGEHKDKSEFSHSETLPNLNSITSDVDLSGAIRNTDTMVIEPPPRGCRYQNDFTNLPPPIESSKTHWYEFIRHIGQGGMGTIYEGRDIKTDRLGRDVWDKPVAIKKLSSDLAYSREKERWDERVRQFNSEVSILKSLEHPNIVTVSDYEDRVDGLYCMMQLLEGEDAEKLLLREGTLTWEETRPIIMDACSGLAAAHNEGIIHLDIKPGNIFVTKNKRPLSRSTTDDMDLDDAEDEKVAKILDFGISKNLKKIDTSDDGKVSGTPAYMAPEQWVNGRIDAKTDIYALGAVIYDFLEGNPPFLPEGSTTRDLWVFVNKISKEEPPMMKNPSMPSGLSDIVMKCLAKDPNDRYHSVKDLRRALKNLDGNSKYFSSPSWTPLPNVKRKPSLKKHIIGGALLAAVIAGGATTGLFLSGNSSEDRQPAPVQDSVIHDNKIVSDKNQEKASNQSTPSPVPISKVLALKTSIPGVEVSLDGVLVGKTSGEGVLELDMSEKEGVLGLVLSRKGYAEKTLRLEVDDLDPGSNIRKVKMEKARRSDPGKRTNGSGREVPRNYSSKSKEPSRKTVPRITSEGTEDDDNEGPRFKITSEQ